MITYTWHEAATEEGLHPVTQVYGVCFDRDGRILLMRQEGKEWNIPGGKPEPGESREQTLEREVYEETTVRIGACAMIGYQDAIEDGGSPIYQLRYAALVRAVDPPLPDPCKGKIHERLFVPSDAVMKYVIYPHYRPMFEAAVRWWKMR